MEPVSSIRCYGWDVKVLVGYCLITTNAAVIWDLGKTLLFAESNGRLPSAPARRGGWSPPSHRGPSLPPGRGSRHRGGGIPRKRPSSSRVAACTPGAVDRLRQTNCNGYRSSLRRLRTTARRGRALWASRLRGKARSDRTPQITRSFRSTKDANVRKVGNILAHPPLHLSSV